MFTKSDNLRETNTSCRNTVQKECYNKREQNNKILFKVQDLNLSDYCLHCVLLKLMMYK